MHLAQYRDQWRPLCYGPSGSIKDGEFLGKLSECQLLKKDSTPSS
jgi:hypothetical protein